MTSQTQIEQLLQSPEPSIRWKVRVQVLGEPPDSSDIQALQEEIRHSPRVTALLQKIGPDGEMDVPVYAKWQGAQWLFMTLADIGYPSGDTRLRPAADAMVAQWLGERYYQQFEAASKQAVYSKLQSGIPCLQGRYRTCASQQGNALYTVLKLGLLGADDPRVAALVERLLHWQWPDGGWNCDKEPSAHTSTFIHTLWSMRGLALYAQRTGDMQAREAAQRAAEIFLSRHLYKRASNGKIIRAEFIKLHYPLYWHYDILGALKVFAEVGITDDPRLQDALDLLQSKQLPDGGWPAEARYYKKVSAEIALGNDYVDWGGVSQKKANPWVSADALSVLRAFGRL